MKSNAQANGASNKAIGSMAYADARTQIATLRQNLTMLQGYWAEKKKDDAVGILKDGMTRLDALDKMPWDGFNPNTKDVKSRALPAVFTDTAKFKEAQDRLQSEVAKLVAVSKNGDEAAVKLQLGATGKACDGCHENFRERQ